MPSKPPSREELAFEWMVGDAKEILAELEAMKADAKKMHAEQQKEHEATLASLAALNKDVVGAYRVFSRVAKDGVQAIQEAARAASKDMVKTSAFTHRRIASVALLSAAVGAAVGVALVLAGFVLFVFP
ncbi:hypothetical protein [Halomonas sp. 3A7M]|uniref:hypothetical protein n=1 Tax=Halomonas sp. 3A7M TaxID=2742616 RepID=UPI001866F54C|nr:hypothetical protein [Halomonas sp. 3A7M]